MLYKKKTWLASLALGFLYSSPYKNKFLTGLKTKNPVLCTRFFLVDKVIEISNLDLMKGLREVVDFIDNSE